MNKQESFMKKGLVKSILNLMSVAGLTLLACLSANAQGDLSIMPGRVVFEGSKKSANVSLANNGKDSAKYEISVVQIRMKDDGTLETITAPDPGQKFADKYFRFFPRVVQLPPNESQTIKLQLTQTDKLAPGEYRSHLYLRAIPDVKKLGEPEPIKDSTTFSARLIPQFGFTIPVLIRIGESNTKVTISDLQFQMAKDTVPSVSFTFNREGNMSVYGDVSVEYISPAGKTTPVGNVRGLAIYTPNTLRKFQGNLDKKAKDVDYTKGKLRIVYTSRMDVKPVKIVEAELTLK